MSQFAYLPKDGGISHMAARRKDGHVPAAIHMHDHEELLLITSPCRCRVVNNGSSLWVQGPALLRHGAGTFHEIVEVQGDYQGRVVFFHPQVLEGLPESLAFSQSLFAGDFLAQPLTAKQAEAFIPLLDLLSEGPAQRQLPMLLAILAQAESCLSQESVRLQARQTYVFDIISLLEATPEEKHSLSQLAERFHVSATKLKTDFSRLTGVSLKTFHSRIRLQKAAALLRGSAMEQAAVAASCGFADESHLIAAFRKAYGTTPGRWRREQ